MNEVILEREKLAEYIKLNKPCKNKQKHIKSEQKLRECKAPDCLWVGTRKQAIKGRSRNQHDTPYYKCPECLHSIQNDYDVSRKTFLKNLPVEDRIVFYLFKKPGSTFSNIWKVLSNRKFTKQEIKWKLSDMVRSDKLYRLGSDIGVAVAKYFIDSDYLTRLSV